MLLGVEEGTLYTLTRADELLLDFGSRGLYILVSFQDSRIPESDLMNLAIRVEAPFAEPFVYECSKPRVRIGKLRGNDVLLRGERFCARNQAALQVCDGSWYLEDLGNNTNMLLNRLPVAPDAPCRLEVGDQISVGDTIITIQAMDT